MRYLTLVFAMLASTGLAHAASHEHQMTRDMSAHDMSSHDTQDMHATMHQGTGVVKAINVMSGKVQIAHEPIASLSWPSMTMWFAVKDMPHDLRVGDAVHFELAQEGKQWVIVTIGRK